MSPQAHSLIRNGRATCPGCGDSGDFAHVLACCQLRRDEDFARGWRSGANHVLGAMRTQVGRRGDVDLGAIADLIAALGGRGEALR